MTLTHSRFSDVTASATVTRKTLAPRDDDLVKDNAESNAAGAAGAAGAALSFCVNTATP